MIATERRNPLCSKPLSNNIYIRLINRVTSVTPSSTLNPNIAEAGYNMKNIMSVILKIVYMKI